ncbi:MAG: histidine kinase [Candidatus Cloacimonetes bacterium HGW-Cloacimonetes-1]|jgi:signal transduction histidine kinase|nr:MAG: histidine kinase [Candidatus Cloacimonetes bacterium HGW-Cloacimonetes-1]
MTDIESTAFASAARASKAETQKDFILIDSDKTIVKVLQAFPNVVMILNEQRQVVYFNKPLLITFEIDDGNDILGLRPGELLECIHAGETAGGCGTTESCTYCGAVLAILAAQEGKSETRECRITTRREGHIEALDLSVHSASFEVGAKNYTFFSFADISSEKRRQALERIFFHDVLNTASAINTTIELLGTGTNPESQIELMEILPIVTKKLINEVKSQQELLLAEQGELVVKSDRVSSLKILRDIVAEYKHSMFYEGKNIEILPDAIDIKLITDETLLKRVLSNMLKNALEASIHSDTIHVGNRLTTDNTIVFFVHNKQVMPDEVRLQVFNRSFSTKGIGRGLGTYSMKLLTERYLHGKMDFRSDADVGTVFEVELKIL